MENREDMGSSILEHDYSLSTGLPMMRESINDVRALTLMVDSTDDSITKIMLRTAIKRVLERDLCIEFDADKVECGPSGDFHKIQKLNQAAASVEPHVTDLTDWIDWHGGNKPPVAPFQKVEVKFKSGVSGPAVASAFRWSHLDNAADIIAYRLAK